MYIYFYLENSLKYLKKHTDILFNNLIREVTIYKSIKTTQIMIIVVTTILYKHKNQNMK